jgi:hypothetical protein
LIEVRHLPVSASSKMAFGPLVKAENAETPIPVIPSLLIILINSVIEDAVELSYLLRIHLLS